MSRVLKCDRCMRVGDSIGYEKNLRWIKTSLPLRISLNKIEPVDLCPGCAQSYKDWLDITGEE